MTIFYLFTGVALIAVVLLDAIGTILTTRGSGVVAGPVTTLVHVVFTRLHRQTSGRGLLVLAGPMGIVLLGTLWVVGTWCGWVLVFLSLPGSVVSSSTAIPADLSGYIYFIGFSLSTLGVGDLVPNGALARLLTVVASLNGLILVTLVITYAVPLVSGAVARRKLAYTIYLMGEGQKELRSRFADVSDFCDWLGQLKGELAECTEQRTAYPLLDLYFGREREFSLGLQLASVGLAAVSFESQEGSLSLQEKRQLDAFYRLTLRYMELTGIDTEDFTEGLCRLVEYDGWHRSELDKTGAQP